MKIELHQIPIRELLEGYEDKSYDGVSTKWTGKEIGKETDAAILNIRPPYQREFIYPAEKQQAVINTVRHGYPLNVMYWVKNSDGSYEVLDGQQRILSLLHFIAGSGAGLGDFTTFTFEEFDEPEEMSFDSLSEKPFFLQSMLIINMYGSTLYIVLRYTSSPDENTVKWEGYLQFKEKWCLIYQDIRFLHGAN